MLKTFISALTLLHKCHTLQFLAPFPNYVTHLIVQKPQINFLYQYLKQVVKEDQKFPKNWRISTIVYSDAFWLYQISRKTSKSSEGNWMNKAGVRTYVLGIKQNKMDKNVIFINDSFLLLWFSMQRESKIVK